MPKRSIFFSTPAEAAGVFFMEACYTDFIDKNHLQLCRFSRLHKETL